MIFTQLIYGILGFVTLIFHALPTVMSTPTELISASAWLGDRIGEILGVLNLLYTPVLFNIIMTIFAAILSLEFTYDFIMWALRKLPIVNLK
jgi:hypothetical protein